MDQKDPCLQEACFDREVAGGEGTIDVLLEQYLQTEQKNLLEVAHVPMVAAGAEGDI